MLQKGFSKILILLIIAVIVAAGVLVYKYWPKPGANEIKMPGINELNKSKPVGSFLLTVTNIQRISNTQARPYLDTVTYKDVLILDLLFTAGPECNDGCYISTLINDYKLTTAEGLLEELGEYSTKFYSAPFLHRKYSGNQPLVSGEKGEHQAYFFINSDDNDFIFTYLGAESGESQSYRLKLK